MKTILVPTDFSKNADNACRYAIEIARETKAKIILMHTFETPVLYTNVPLMTMQLDYTVLYNSALAELKKYHNKISKATRGIHIELILQQGLASARIVEIALEKKADLVVMGTTGKGAMERMMMGSNATRIIREAPCMVMAIPPRAKYEGLKKLVYATDLLNDNLEHTKTLIPFAKMFNSEILFLNINTQLLSANEDDNLKTTTKKIKAHIKYPKTSGFVCNDANITTGIHYFLKKHKADCLVMYTHHRNILQSIFKPSVTKEIAFQTSVPLLVIHDKDFMEENHPVKIQREEILN
jgi:nucleotide-binding universal stress UspA family protein